MRRAMAVLLWLGFLLPAGLVSAQAETQFSTLEIDLWPEYDRSEMLVIYKAELASSVSIPAEISMRIPAAAGEPYNLAYQEMDGQLYNLAYDLQTEGQWLRVTFNTPSPVFQMEYYDPALQRDGDRRSFQYLWSGDYTVQNLRLSVQKPASAEPLEFVPAMDAPVVGGDGLMYSTKDVGEVRQGTQFTLRLSYDKPDDVLTTAGLQPVEPSGPIPSDEQSGSLLSALPLVFATAGLLLLGLGIAWMVLQRRRVEPASGRNRRRSRSRPADPAAGGTSLESVYCQNCGKRAAPGDAFCRACGSRLRT